MNVFAHPDPVVLEAELLRRVAAAQAADPLAGVLVIVPTSRLARHVTRRLAEAHGARLGIVVTHHQALAARVLAEGPGRRMRVLSEVLHAALVKRVLETLPDHPWGRYARERPGAIRAVAATLADLREAGISAAELREALAGEAEAHALRDALAAYEVALARLVRDGLADEPGLVRLALPHVAAWASRFVAAIHHGAYELIGVHLELVRAIDRSVPVDFLLPALAAAPAYETANRFAGRSLLPEGQSPRPIAGAAGSRIGAEHLAALYDEGARPVPLPAEALRVHHTQGTFAEVTLAVRHALRAVACGVPPREIAIVARSLDAYAPEIEAVFADEGIPWSGSAASPLRRDPAIRELLLLLRAVADDFPRRATCELLASAQLRWEQFLPAEPPPRGDLAERFSLEASVTGGLTEWTEDLPAWADQAAADEAASTESSEGRKRFAAWRAVECRRMARGVAGIRRRMDSNRPHGWSGHADALEALARDFLPGFAADPPSPAAAALFQLLDEMRQLTLVLAAEGAVPFETMVTWLEQAVDATELPAAESRAGTIQVLDSMQARGLTFQTVLLLGVHAGSFPRASRTDPLFDDRARQRLAQATRRPVPVKSDGDAEERLLLALGLGSAARSVQLSWQRADDSGRVRPVSLALREIARLSLGEPDLERLVQHSAARFPAHPESWIEALAREPGLVTQSEALLLTALRSKDPSEARRALGSARPDLDLRLALLEAVEAFGASALRYDGIVGGAGALAAPLSVGALETLGVCPLRFFFKHVLRIDPADEDPGLFEFDGAEQGIWAHETLRRTYAGLAQEGWTGPGRARELLDAAWRDATGPSGRLLRRRVPVFWEAYAGMWVNHLVRFVERDLARLAADGLEITELEASRERVLALGEGVEVKLRGRLDRVASNAERRVVGDYKTGKSFAAGASLTEMVRGRALQVPLYSWMEDGAEVELLPVRAAPRFLEPPDADGWKRFDGFPDGAEAGFRETLRVLAELAAAGAYPLRAGDHCAHCPYERACRHDHPPTAARMELLAASTEPASGFPRLVQRYRRLDEKDRAHPSFAALDGNATPDAR